jgi:hypothetical protein
MVTKHSFLITMVISAAVAALILAYSAPTQGAGAVGKGSTSGASKTDIGGTSNVDIGGTSKTKIDQIENVRNPVNAGVTSPKSNESGGTSSANIPLDAKGKKIDAGAAILGNPGVAGKIGAGKLNPNGGASGKTREAGTSTIHNPNGSTTTVTSNFDGKHGEKVVTQNPDGSGHESEHDANGNETGSATWDTNGNATCCCSGC